VVGWKSRRDDGGLERIGKVDLARGRIGVNDLRMEGKVLVMEEARMMGKRGSLSGGTIGGKRII
jgi:hypothetical protein